MYNETCMNRSCSKAEALLRRTDRFDLVCFLYALSRISKAKTVKSTLLQTDNFFLSSDKKATCLTRTQIKIQEFTRNIIKLHIFVNFYTLKQQYFFFHFILQFWRSTILLSRTLYLFFQVALCNKPMVVLRHWKQYRTETFKPYSTLLWTIGFSTVTYIKLWWNVKDLQKNAIKI